MVDPVASWPEPVRPLFRAEYDRLVELGVFDDERLELLDGRLVPMSPQGAPHSDAVRRISERLFVALGGRAQVRTHSPVALSDRSEPEPDVAVVPPGDYTKTLPATALLVVEVADSSVRRDRALKGPLYAAAGVPEYWIVNLPRLTVEVHRDPDPAQGTYGTVTTLGRGQSARVAAFPDVELSVDEMVGGGG